MPAYMIFTRTSGIKDADAMAAYSGSNRSNAGDSVSRYGLKPLAVYGKLETMEGEAPDGIVLLEFPDADAARAWYNSPEYQKAVPLRQAAADYTAVLIEGL